MTLKLDLYDKKLLQSTFNHKQALQEMSLRMMRHTSKVDSFIRKGCSEKKNEKDVLEYLAKVESINKRKEKQKNDLILRLERKKRESMEKNKKMDLKKIENQEIVTKRAENLEKKHFRSFEALKKNKKN